MSWLRDAVLQALNSSFSRKETVRGQKEFHRGHVKPLRGACKDSPQEAAAHGEGEGEGGYPLTHREEPRSSEFHEAESQAGSRGGDMRQRWKWLRKNPNTGKSVMLKKMTSSSRVMRGRETNQKKRT